MRGFPQKIIKSGRVPKKIQHNWGRNVAQQKSDLFMNDAFVEFRTV